MFHCNTEMTDSATIPVLRKAIEVFQAVIEDGGVATQAQLARQLSVAPSTCHRILKTFTAFDWLRPTTNGGYELSLGLLPLVRSLGNYQRVFEQFRTPLATLVEQTQLMSKISIKQGERAITVFRVESPRDLFPTSKIGASFPLAYGSSGACLFSGLTDVEIETVLAASPKEVWQRQTREEVWQRIREVRAKGVTHDAGHYHAKLQTVSAPVRTGKGDVFCALTLLGWSEDFAGKRLAQIKTQVQRTAAECSALLIQAKS
jgi:DNA-binding IclR family transcriptional regulator